MNIIEEKIELKVIDDQTVRLSIEDKPTWLYLTPIIVGGNYGDMWKAEYDQNNDGVVDNAEKVGGIPASNLLQKTDYIDCGTF